MNTIERTCPPRSLGRLACAMLGAIALSSAVFACTAPTDPDPGPNEPSEPTATQSEALANNGGGGGTSTCESRWQSCYVSCGVLYGLKDPKTQAQCEDLCDEIHADCKGFASPLAPRPILNTPPVSVIH